MFYGFLLFKNKIYTSFTLSQIFYLSLFSSPDPKGHVRYCHHLASIRPLTFSYFNILLWKQLGQMEPNLAESIYIRSTIKFLRFVPFRQQIWPPRAILVSDWLILKKSSPLKLLGQMEPNLAGSIYVRSSIKLLHLVPFGQG